MSEVENKILKKFEATNVIIEVIDGVPMFELYSTGLALGYVNYGKNKNNPLPHKKRINTIVENAGIKGCVHGVNTYLNESQLYDFMIESKSSKCKEFKKWITTEVLPTYNRTGGFTDEEYADTFIDSYFPNLSEGMKKELFSELIVTTKLQKEENARLQKFYDDLISTEGLMSMNVVAKELKIGLKRLYLFLRTNEVMFYKGNINVPYQRFMEQKLFEIKETPCKDGKYRPQTYATKKGMEYIRKLLVKKNKICTE